MKEHWHLPDIPNVGYATQREREGTDQIMTFLRDIERERGRLLAIVCDGREKWRRVARNVFGTALNIDDEALDAMFRYLELLACKPGFQRQLLDAKDSAEWRGVMREAMPDIEAQRESLKLVAKWAP